jgi:CHASE3 domain sensor protein
MNSNFKRNLLIGFSASLVILLISSVASYLSIMNLLKSIELVNNTNEVIMTVNNARTALVDAETGQRGFLLAGREEFLDPYRDAREKAYDAFDHAKKLTANNPRQQSSLSDLDQLMAERFRYLELAIEQKRNNQEIPVVQLEKGREIMTKVRDLIMAIERNEKELLASRTESMNRFASFTPPLIISAAMIALFITVLFYFRVRSDFDERVKLQLQLQRKDEDITNRIQIIDGIANKISQGNYDVRVNDRESDALGNVAGSLNKMAESLQYSFGLLSDKEWLQTGLTKLNDVMIGEKSEEALASEVIEMLSSYTGSNAGALYVLRNNQLHAAAGYAYVPPKSRQIIEINDGILGQCIATRAMVELKQIPSDNIIISFATGEARPGHVVAVPVTDGYTIKGAVELASISGFSRRHIEFFTTGAANIGIAISTAQNRKRLQELLEETQAQSEEL